jgi:hypothetical protein
MLSIRIGNLSCRLRTCSVELRWALLGPQRPSGSDKLNQSPTKTSCSTISLGIIHLLEKVREKMHHLSTRLFPCKSSLGLLIKSADAH